MILRPIEEVSEKDLKSFSCGNIDLDDFLRKYAFNNDKKGFGRTFLLEDMNEIVGFFTLCSASIKYQELPDYDSASLPKYPIPCIKIARLGVKKEKQRKGYGKALLKEAFLKILSVVNIIGIRLVLVDAKESSASFYEQFGFRKLQEEKLSFFLLVDTLKQIEF
ncbi:MAG: GNAT family N-acetyltransferase [Acholeplasmataceae bacterium]|jgi:GNAT superfamily N-acetyltransferase